MVSKTLIVDNLSNSKIEVLDGIEKITGVKPAFEKLDLTDATGVKDLLDKHDDIEGIIHFAAKKAVGESVEKPLLYYKTNINSTINLIENINPNFKNIVFSSSCTVYGQPDQLPVTENTPFKPAESPYGATKQICEQILKDFSRANSDFNAISLRYFNPVGAHPSASIGEYPNGVPNNLVPFITQTAAGIRQELKVFGDDYDTPDGSCIRDYIHIVDLAKAHVTAIKRLLNNEHKENYEFFNLGTGKGSSVLEVVKSFEKVNEIDLNYRIVERRPGDVVKIYADTSLANNELGWKAEKGLKEMLSSAWRWQKTLS